LAIIETGELEIEFHLHGKQYLRPHQIAIFNPDQVHFSKNKNIKSLGYYGLHVDLQWCKNIQTNLFGAHEKFLDIQFNIIDEKSIYDALIKSFQKILFNKESLKNESVEDILVDIFRKYSQADTGEEKNTDEIKDENTLLNNVEKYILSNIENQITLKDIAREVGYNESYIIRVFKKKFGLTPHAFIVNKKVNQAKNKLLKSDEINLAQLASEVGFYDQSHLNKTFKRVFAKSPNNYKKE